MTDRVQYLTVTLDSDYRTDDIETLVAAIEMLRGVRAVQKGKPVNMEDHMARMRVGTEIYNAVVDAARKIVFPK